MSVCSFFAATVLFFEITACHLCMHCSRLNGACKESLVFTKAWAWALFSIFGPFALARQQRWLSCFSTRVSLTVAPVTIWWYWVVVEPWQWSSRLEDYSELERSRQRKMVGHSCYYCAPGCYTTRSKVGSCTKNFAMAKVASTTHSVLKDGYNTIE